MQQKQTTLFELLDHDYSLYHTDYSKTQEYLRIQELKKEKYSLKTTVQELQSKKFSLGADDLICCCTGVINPNFWQIKIMKILISYRNTSFFNNLYFFLI